MSSKNKAADLSKLAGIEDDSPIFKNDFLDQFGLIHDFASQAGAIICLSKAHYLGTTDGIIDTDDLFFALRAVLFAFEAMREENKAFGDENIHPDRVKAIDSIDAIAARGIKATEDFSRIISDERPIKIGVFIASLDAILAAADDINVFEYKDYLKKA
ncbi:MAG: hypothetical protein Q8Q50_08515 [Methylobacter sp.]|nr:hypothetical protein [Methylobacter sp.]